MIYCLSLLNMLILGHLFYDNLIYVPREYDHGMPQFSAGSSSTWACLL